MRRNTVLEALLRLCGSKLMGSETSPQLSVPPRLIAAAVVGAGSAARVAGGAVAAPTAPDGDVVGAGVAAGAQAAANPIKLTEPTALSHSRRVRRCVPLR